MLIHSALKSVLGLELQGRLPLAAFWRAGLGLLDVGAEVRVAAKKAAEPITDLSLVASSPSSPQRVARDVVPPCLRQHRPLVALITGAAVRVRRQQVHLPRHHVLGVLHQPHWTTISKAHITARAVLGHLDGGAVFSTVPTPTEQVARLAGEVVHARVVHPAAVLTQVQNWLAV